MSSINAQDGPLSSNNLSSPHTTKSPERQPEKWHHRFSRRLFGRDDGPAAAATPAAHNGLSKALPPTSNLTDLSNATDSDITQTAFPRSRFSRQVIPRLPRPATFRRQLSERRERLSPSDITHTERRTLSVDRRRAFSTRPASPSATFLDARISAPAVYDLPDRASTMRAQSIPALPQQHQSQQANINAMLMQRPTNPPTPPPDDHSHVPDGASRNASVAVDIQAELESKWILNLSMHFRDKSPREKFFVTYAETPTRWRRVTVSCDYRNAPPDSLEADLRNLTYQRDKSARIYESIRTSLPDIQFYDTVTNLRLETSADERLHVHVTEDVNEIIPYPDKHLLSHLSSVPHVSEEEVHFLSHMSGFVYKVRVGNEVLVKKEIPGPDSVEEFLYEINALSSLLGSSTVVQIRGLVLDDDSHTVTGLLIDYYDRGPLVDILFDHRGDLSWERRAKWATQIIQGLSEVHEAGFVQGDFTVSNVCVGADDNARIIDINRRGCPVGWEPPEIAAMIESGQRISMYIGVKSDLFQLGMVLWAIANEDDEPERRQRPLRLDDENESNSAPSWYRHITHLCLDPQPSRRPAANKLLDSALSASQMLSTTRGDDSLAEVTTHTWGSSSTAVPTLTRSRDNSRKPRSLSPSPSFDEQDEMPRGRSPPHNSTHLGSEWHRNYLDECASRDSRFLLEDEVTDQDALGPFQADESQTPDPEIVPIDPTGEGWREVTVNGRGYIMRDDRSEPLALNDSLSPSIPATLPEVPTAPDPPSRAFKHIDSGLGDMDLDLTLGPAAEQRSRLPQEPQLPLPPL